MKKIAILLIALMVISVGFDINLSKDDYDISVEKKVCVKYERIRQ